VPLRSPVDQTERVHNAGQSQREFIRLLRRFRGLGRLIGAVTKPGDLVVDPAGGNFVVLRTPMAPGRVFIGCDIAHHREDQTAA